MARPRKRRAWFGTSGFRPDLLPPWPEQRLPLATAKAMAALIQSSRLGRCAVIPGTDGWDVLVELGPVPGHGELLVLATLGDAAPLLGRAFRTMIQRHGRDTEPLGTRAERQIREALADVLAKQEAQEEAKR